MSGRYHQTLALECWHCRSKCTCMALCYSAFVFDQKHVFLLNIHTGHTMLHTVCEQAGSTVCLWMAPHFQTSANGNISEGHKKFYIVIFMLSQCHSVSPENSAIASLYFPVVDCLPASGVVCLWMGPHFDTSANGKCPTSSHAIVHIHFVMVS